MKRKIKLSVLNVESLVTSKEKNNALLGGSLPTDTDNPNVCINYSALNICKIYSANPILCPNLSGVPSAIDPCLTAAPPVC